MMMHPGKKGAGGSGSPRPPTHRTIHFLNALATVPIPSKLIDDGSASGSGSGQHGGGGSSYSSPGGGTRGVQAYQVAANGSTKPVVLKLSRDKFTLALEPVKNKRSGFLSIGWGSGSDGKTVTVDIGEMDRIQRGQSTIDFERARKNMKIQSVVTTTNGSGGDDVECCAASTTGQGGGVSSTATVSSRASSSAATVPEQLDPNRSFSIIFRGAHTLDFMTTSHQSQREVCDALDRLLVAYQRAKRRVASDVQLLRYVWLHTAGANPHGKQPSPTAGGGSKSYSAGLANAATVNKILQEINYALPTRNNQFQSTYDKFGKVIGLDRAQRRSGLTFEQTATFLHKLKRDSWMVKPVTVLWNEIFGEVMNNGKMRASVSDKTFLERFLHNQQGDVQSTLLDVRKLFRRLHDMEIAHTPSSSSGLIDPNRINKDQFEAYLLMHENDAFDPQKECFDKADMEQPLSEYWINRCVNLFLLGSMFVESMRRSGSCRMLSALARI